MNFSVHEAKQLSKLLDLIEQGEDVVIERHGKPVARLVRAQVGILRKSISDSLLKAITVLR